MGEKSAEELSGPDLQSNETLIKLQLLCQKVGTNGRLETACEPSIDKPDARVRAESTRKDWKVPIEESCFPNSGKKLIRNSKALQIIIT